MHSIQLGREYYSKSEEIFNHIKETFNLDHVPFEAYNLDEGLPVHIRQDFGYTTITFDFETDLKCFKAWLKPVEDV